MDFIVSQGAARGLLHATPLGSIKQRLKRRRELNVVVLANGAGLPRGELGPSLAGLFVMDQS